MNASVGICTVPRERIFFLPPHAAPAARGPLFLIVMLGGNEFRLRNFPPHSGSKFTAHLRRPASRGPRRAKEDAFRYSSSNLSTAINASVGICTVPRERIFFLPSFCFSSSFFFRVMSPP